MPVALSLQTNLKSVRANLAQIQRSIGKDLTPQVLNAAAFEGRQGAIRGLDQDVDRPRPGTRRAIRYTRFDRSTGTASVEVQGKTGKKHVTAALAKIVYGHTQRYSGYGAHRLLVPVAKDAKDRWGNLNRRLRSRIRRAGANTRAYRGSKIHFQDFPKGIGVFEQFGYGKFAPNQGRRLVAWAPNSATWKKDTYRFHSHVETAVRDALPGIIRKELNRWAARRR